MVKAQSDRWPRWTGALLLLLVLFSLGGGCLARSYDHDEAQFVAAGALLARAGLLPYVDYPFFHLPNLAFAYAVLYQTNGFLLLSARAFNVLCAWLLLLLVYLLTARAFAAAGEKRWLIAAGLTVFLGCHPLFRFVAGRAWNHDLPMLATVAALATFLRGVSSKGGWLLCSGALLGVAVGTRLTFLPLLVPFLAILLLAGNDHRGRLRGSLVFCAAFVGALLPTLLLFLRAPDAFFYCNVTANDTLNLQYRDSREPLTSPALQKAMLVLRQLKSPATLLTLVGFGFFACWLPWRHGWGTAPRSIHLVASLALVPFAILGAWLPTPAYRQYLYQPLPFMLLACIYGMAAYGRRTNHSRVFALVAFGAATAFLQFVFDWRGANFFNHPRSWPVWSLPAVGEEIRSYVGSDARVLTLSAIQPLEGGLTIYPQLATGPFAWRLAPFARSEDRDRYGFPTRDLRQLTGDRPAAILTGYEYPSLDRPLVAYARDLNYRGRTLHDGKGVLWQPEPGPGAAKPSAEPFLAFLMHARPFDLERLRRLARRDLGAGVDPFFGVGRGPANGITQNLPNDRMMIDRVDFVPGTEIEDLAVTAFPSAAGAKDFAAFKP